MTIKPFGNQILVKPVEQKKVLINQDNPSMCEYGEVVDVGDEVQKIKVGETIGFTVFGINSLKIDEQKYYFITETPEFILGTITM